MSIKYKAHCTNIGWQDTVKDGMIAGTIGEARPMEAFIIEDTGISNLGIHGFAHVSNHGWSSGNVLGEVIGSTGNGNPIEAIKIGLIGPEANNYDIWYRAHVSDYGFLNWSCNGEEHGTVGGAKAIEAIQIEIHKKSENWYPYVDNPNEFMDLTPKAPVSEIRNFTPDEFKCRCGCGGDVKHELKVKVQALRDLLGEPIVITSGYRCSYQNRLDGGVGDSLHLTGEACDLYSPNMSRAKLDHICNLAHQVGLGTLRYYSNQFIHVQLYMTDRVMN